MPEIDQPIDNIKQQIKQRLSLRKPQQESLDILSDILKRIELSKQIDLDLALTTIKSFHPSVESFERNFPTFCFSLATGVGKTRLMGAFIAYLFLQKTSTNFIVIAPNTTIYEKLISDFTQGSDKYVFKGISELTENSPVIVTGDNWDNGKIIDSNDLFTNPIINIFNVDKINRDRGLIREFRETIGESYFDFLAGLPDLVMLMDEAHRYRAKAGMKAIAKLNPILGIEVTATPKTVGSKSIDFMNVIYSYPLGNAMNDGYVKVPAVATRENFNFSNLTQEQLQDMKLYDGVKCHENTQEKLYKYAKSNNLPVVKPFMLVVAKDTTHSHQILKKIKSVDFFDGRYKNKVIEVNSALKGEENENATKKLLELEHTAETEIVIHVNKLKEGWDVNNLYTIVPLRASASEILTLQTLGRGLRLPYGIRTGDAFVDLLTIVAHDRYDEVIKKAKEPNSIVQMKSVVINGEGVITENVSYDSYPSKIEEQLIGGGKIFENSSEQIFDNSDKKTTKQQIFSTFEKKQVARKTLDVIQQEYESRCKNGFSDLQSETIIQEISVLVDEEMKPIQETFNEFVSTPDIEEIVRVTVKMIVEDTIEIPEILIESTSEVNFWYNDFDLTYFDLSNLPLITDNIIIADILSRNVITFRLSISTNLKDRLVDYIIPHLMKRNEIEYQKYSKLLYKLTEQAVKNVKLHFKTLEEQKNICLFHGREIAEIIFSQMKDHYYQTQTEYEAKVIKGFTFIKSQNYNLLKFKTRDFRSAAKPLINTQNFLFIGFNKCCFNYQKFDSNSERQFAELLESPTEISVLKWMKLSMNQFHINYNFGQHYVPDFLIETNDQILIVEVKGNKDINDVVVQQKAKATKNWIYHVNLLAKKVGKKNWFYIIIPHNEIKLSSTLSALISRFIYL